MVRRRSTPALAVLGAALALAVPVAAATLAPSPGAAGTAGTAGAAQSAGAPTAEANPPTAGAVAVHDVSAGTDATPNATTPRTTDAEPNASVRTIRLRYPGSANVSLSGVGPDDVQPYVVHGAGTADARRESLAVEGVSVGERTVTVRLADTGHLDANDSVGLRVAGVHNPPTPGRVTVSLTLVADGGARRTVRAGIDIRPPRPRVEPGSISVVVEWPANVSGFLVVEVDNRRVDVSAYDPPEDRRIEVSARTYITEWRTNLRLEVTAYRDVDGDGAFDPDVDRPFRRDGDPVSYRTELYVDTTTATASTTPATGSTTTTPTTADDGPPGGGLPPAAVLGLCAGLLAAVLAGRRLRR